MKLIDKVKPEVLEILTKKTKIDYNASYRSIIASFKNKKFYRDLTINEVDNIITFLPEEHHPEGRIDFYYGDFLIQKELKYKY